MICDLSFSSIVGQGYEVDIEVLQASQLIGETGVNSLVIVTEQDFIKLYDLLVENSIHVVNGMK